MKSIQTYSLVIGIFIGLVMGGVAPSVQKLFAQDQKKESLSDEEINKHLDEILEAQVQLKKKLEDITIQTQFLKASSGK